MSKNMLWGAYFYALGSITFMLWGAYFYALGSIFFYSKLLIYKENMTSLE